MEAGIQHHIPSSKRATLLSVASFFQAGFALIIMLGFGLLSEIGDLTWGFLGFAGLVIIYTLTMLFLKRNES